MCYLLNLLNGFQNPARKSASCYIENFPANSEKNRARSSSKTSKMATLPPINMRLARLIRVFTSFWSV